MCATFSSCTPNDYSRQRISNIWTITLLPFTGVSLHFFFNQLVQSLHFSLARSIKLIFPSFSFNRPWPIFHGERLDTWLLLIVSVSLVYRGLWATLSFKSGMTRAKAELSMQLRAFGQLQVSCCTVTDPDLWHRCRAGNGPDYFPTGINKPSAQRETEDVLCLTVHKRPFFHLYYPADVLEFGRGDVERHWRIRRVRLSLAGNRMWRGGVELVRM